MSLELISTYQLELKEQWGQLPSDIELYREIKVCKECLL